MAMDRVQHRDLESGPDGMAPANGDGMSTPSDSEDKRASKRFSSAALAVALHLTNGQSDDAEDQPASPSDATVRSATVLDFYFLFFF